MLDFALDGYEALQKRMRDLQMRLHQDKIVRAVEQAGVVVMRDARVNAPVDTGRLRNSITVDVRREAGDVKASVGSNVAYSPYVEFGTRPHWPPKGALRKWARRHKIPEFLVARAIAIRGTKARWYLLRAYERNVERIYRIIDRAVRGWS